MPSQCLPDGVERWVFTGYSMEPRSGLLPDGAGGFVPVSDLPKIEEQAIQKERERLGGLEDAVERTVKEQTAGVFTPSEVAYAVVRGLLAALEEDDRG